MSTNSAGNRILKLACSGMFSDQLDKMGFRHQVIAGLSVNKSLGKIYGPTRTIKLETLKTNDERIKKGLGFIGTMKAGEVLCVEASREFAYFGELMSRLSIRQKLGGVVIGGLTRDSFFTQNLKNLTIFSEGFSPKDIKGRGRVKETDVKIKIQEVPIASGDWLFADRDGIVIIPQKQQLELEQKILRIIENEGSIIQDIRKGTSIPEILKKYKEF